MHRVYQQIVQVKEFEKKPRLIEEYEIFEKLFTISHKPSATGSGEKILQLREEKIKLKKATKNYVFKFSWHFSICSLYFDMPCSVM